jgi:NADPH-dependent dioxygenase
MAQPPREQPDVLVAGAGPVGLTMAHELARRGLRVRLVDAAAGPVTTSRAIATHPRTLEIYDAMGVIDEVLARGRRIRAFTIVKDGHRLARLDADYRTMPTRYPYTVIIEQVHTEAVLRQAVAKLGVEVEWGVRLEELAQDESGVRARLRRPDGTVEDTEVPWLVGCDGGHSTVRKQLGLALIGDSRETWMLADASVTCDLPPDSIYWIQSSGQALMMVPLAGDGRWRLLDTADVRPDAPPDEIAVHFGRKLTAGTGHTVTVADPEWVSVFTFQQRMVPSMRVGRCFVAGDAAHVHSPASGQGMNTGIHEAFNLAWKLALVARGQAGEELLDSYSAERVPIGGALLGSTRRATFLVQLKNSVAGLLLPAVFAVVRTVRPVRLRLQRKMLGGMSGLNLAYPDSPLTVPAEHGEGRGPRPGQRVTTAIADPLDPGGRALAEELRDPRWTLLVAAGKPETTAVAVDAQGRYDDRLSVRVLAGSGVHHSGPGGRLLPDPGGTVTADLGLTPGTWLLVRPDGYLLTRGRSGARLEQALVTLFPARSAASIATTDA